jgi:CheY-like chemotaxis protein
MVKQMAELHGGAVAVASAEGQGSVFAAWLPIREPAAARAVVSPGLTKPQVAATMPGARVALVIEDDDKSAELLTLLLKAEGFNILRAASAEEALVLAPQQSLSLITLDIQLPGMDGWAFLEQVRKDNGTLAHVPVVVVAALDYADLALTRGAGAVLQKPVSRAKLKVAMDHLGLPPAKESPYTVLIVDDDPKAVEVISTFLPSPTYTVVRAYGGRRRSRWRGGCIRT